MELSSITVLDFKTQFTRDFPYLNSFSLTGLYNIGDVVYYPTTLLFYQCKVDGTTNIAPTVTNNWTRITDSINNYIQDADINNAFLEAEQVFNDSLFTEDKFEKLAYLYLTAHFLVTDIRNSTQGVNSKGEGIVNSRSVGSMSESYEIPEIYSNDPVFSFYAKTGYGLKYLNMVVPLLRGNVQSILGWTQA